MAGHELGTSTRVRRQVPEVVLRAGARVGLASWLDVRGVVAVGVRQGGSNCCRPESRVAGAVPVAASAYRLNAVPARLCSMDGVRCFADQGAPVTHTVHVSF